MSRAPQRVHGARSESGQIRLMPVDSSGRSQVRAAFDAVDRARGGQDDAAALGRYSRPLCVPAGALRRMARARKLVASASM